MLLRSIQVRNLLSFKDTSLDFRPLNVIIGPNASGKSNLIDVIGLLHAAPADLPAAIRNGGPIRDWIWKGTDADERASIECTVRIERELSYLLRFAAAGPNFEILSETLKPSERKPDDPASFFSRGGSHLEVMASEGPPPARVRRTSDLGQVTESALREFRSPLLSPEAAGLARGFEGIRIFRDWDTSAVSEIRRGVPANSAGEYLSATGHNLALVLNHVEGQPERERIEAYLKRLLEGFEKLYTRVEEGMVRVRVQEQGLGIIPASRLSDGTLRFLCLMTALFQPKPPPLICLEEPEIGLHPDALQLVAEAVREASERTQLILTTHSEAFVDALSADPESVVICERDFDNSTQFRRLEQDKLTNWLKRYRLGELWRKGELGGNRW